MNRSQRRAARAQARKRKQNAMKPGADVDRQHLLNANIKEVKQLSGKADDGDVIVICDTRDDVARQWVERFGSLNDDELKRWEAPILLGGTIPTALLVVTREVAIDATAHHSPQVSEALEIIPETAGQVVLVISAGGTRMVKLP